MKVQWYIRTQAFLTLLGIRGLNQTDLAGLTKIHSSDLSLFINREKSIGVGRMSRIKSRLGISDEALLDFFEPVGGDESPFRKNAYGNGSAFAPGERPIPGEGEDTPRPEIAVPGAVSAGRTDNTISGCNS
jgi:hypothetical protein